jgi:hypothetical protein
MTRRRAAFVILLACVFAGLGLILFAASNPLRRSDSRIRSQLLEEAPLGSSILQVSSIIFRHGWTLAYPLADTGFYDQRSRPARIVGKKHLRASLGNYQDIPWRANVTVFWGFDENDRLIDVWVWKTWNGL